MLILGAVVGLTRGILASTGWYIVEHDGGPLQVPAFALSMLAWPEAALLDSPRVTAAPPAFYVALCALLVVSTSVWAVLAAATVNGHRPSAR